MDTGSDLESTHSAPKRARRNSPDCIKTESELEQIEAQRKKNWDVVEGMSAVVRRLKTSYKHVALQADYDKRKMEQLSLYSFAGKAVNSLASLFVTGYDITARADKDAWYLGIIYNMWTEVLGYFASTPAHLAPAITAL